MRQEPGVWTRRLLVACVTSIAALAGTARAADSFPSRPITLVLGLSAGGATDVQVRALAKAASRELGQPIVVFNRAGMSGTLGPANVAESAAPDGYTLAVLPATIFRIPHVQKVKYDFAKDFTYLLNVTEYSYAIVVPAASPFKTLPDLVRYAKENPGKLAYGTSGIGGTGHVNVERFAKAAGVQLNMVPFVGAAPVFQSLLGGYVSFAAEGGFGPMAESGQVRVLGVFGESRLPMHPEWPTLREQGYRFDEASSFWGLAGPRGLDPKVASRLHDAFKKALDDPEFKEVLAKSYQVVRYQNGKDFAEYGVARGRDELKAIKELGIKFE